MGTGFGKARRTMIRLLAILAVAFFLPTGMALGHGGDTSPGHHDEEAPAKSGSATSGKDKRPGSSGKDVKGSAKSSSDDEEASPAGATGGSGGGGNPVPHFIALVGLAAIGTGVIIFRRNRAGHATQPGQPAP